MAEKSPSELLKELDELNGGSSTPPGPEHQYTEPLRDDYANLLHEPPPGLSEHEQFQLHVQLGAVISIAVLLIFMVYRNRQRIRAWQASRDGRLAISCYLAWAAFSCLRLGGRIELLGMDFRQLEVSGAFLFWYLAAPVAGYVVARKTWHWVQSGTR